MGGALGKQNALGKKDSIFGKDLVWVLSGGGRKKGLLTQSCQKSATSYSFLEIPPDLLILWFSISRTCFIDILLLVSDFKTI